MLRFLEKDEHPLARLEYHLEQVVAFCRSFSKGSEPYTPPWRAAWTQQGFEVANEMGAVHAALRKSRTESPE